VIRVLLTGVGNKNHETCNLGSNPSHAVVTRKDNIDSNNIIKILTSMSDRYCSSQKDWNKFQLFNSTKYGSVSNMLFTDSTTELKAIASDKQSYNAYLGKDYGENREAMISCTSPPTTAKTNKPTSVSTTCTVSPIIEFVLLIALLGSAQRLL